MKTAKANFHPRRSREGSAVLVILILLGIMVVLSAANTATLNRLQQRVKIVEQRQTQRLESPATISPPAAGAATNQPSK